MKQLVILTIRKKISDLYFNNLSEIFGKFLSISAMSIEETISTEQLKVLSRCDLLIVTNPSLLGTFKKYIKPLCKVISMEYTFSKTDINKLKKIPQGSKGLVCFNYYSVSKYITKLIYNIGIFNLNLHIYDNDDELNLQMERFDFIITDSSTLLKPCLNVPTINLDERKISYSTMLEISNATNIMTNELELTLEEYVKNIAIPENFLDEMNLYSNSFKFQLKTIVDNIDYGILIIKENKLIINNNAALLKMFNIKKNIIDKTIDELSSFGDIKKFIEIKHDIKDELIVINEREILLTKKLITKRYFSERIDILLFNDISEILKLQKNLSERIEKHGYTAKYYFKDIYGFSKEIKDCISKASKMSLINRPVLILGETGTGKELFAQSIHNNSERNKFPFIAINVAALPSTLLESELFGYDDGTFTGGKKGGKTGIFQKANNGTIFLDEIGDMPIETQVKLLRVLEEKEIMKLGGDELLKVNVRIIAATNKNLEKLIEENKFRLDLYYRLNTMVLKIPPLRERKEDIKFLIKKFIRESDSGIVLSHEVEELLINHPWRGNVRELKNTIDYLTDLYSGIIETSDLPPYIHSERTNDNKTNIFELKKLILLEIKQGCHGRRSILNKLKNKNINITEYKLRKILDSMRDDNLITISSGRNALNITKIGKESIQ